MRKSRKHCDAVFLEVIDFQANDLKKNLTLTLIFRQHCEIIKAKNNKEYFLSSKFVMKEGLDAFLKRIQLHFPEIDSKRKLLKFIPFFVKTKAFGWATQCTCVKHADFVNSMDYVNRLAANIDELPKLTYENFEDHFCCQDVLTDTNDSTKILKKLRCFSRWETNHCFRHKTKKSSCEGKKISIFLNCFSYGLIQFVS